MTMQPLDPPNLFYRKTKDIVKQFYKLRLPESQDSKHAAISNKRFRKLDVVSITITITKKQKDKDQNYQIYGQKSMFCLPPKHL